MCIMKSAKHYNLKIGTLPKKMKSLPLQGQRNPFEPILIRKSQPTKKTAVSTPRRLSTLKSEDFIKLEMAHQLIVSMILVMYLSLKSYNPYMPQPHSL